jgi:hypothetical protein
MSVETVVGVVKSIEGKTITMQDGSTFTLSKFGEPPKVGEEQTLSVLTKTFENGETVRFASLPLPKRAYTGASGAGYKKEDPDRQKKIIRQNVLAHATALSVAKNDTAMNKVLLLAGQLEEWVNRP